MCELGLRSRDPLTDRVHPSPPRCSLLLLPLPASHTPSRPPRAAAAASTSQSTPLYTGTSSLSDTETSYLSGVGATAWKYDQKIKMLMLGDVGVGKTALMHRWTEDTFHSDMISTAGVDYKSRVLTLDDKCVQVQVWDTAGQERFHVITHSYYRGCNAILVVYVGCGGEGVHHRQPRPTGATDHDQHHEARRHHHHHRRRHQLSHRPRVPLNTPPKPPPTHHLRYDVSEANDPDFERLEYWLEKVKSHASTNCEVALLCNKIDMFEGKTPSELAQEPKIAGARRIAEAEGLHLFLTSAKSGAGVEDAYNTVVSSAIEKQNRGASVSSKVSATHHLNGHITDTARTGAARSQAERPNEPVRTLVRALVRALDRTLVRTLVRALVRALVWQTSPPVF